MNQPIIKVGIVGPESTGKSAVAASLAAHFHTSWAPEFARAFLTMRNGVYNFETLDKILAGQLEEEKAALSKASQIVFFDTTPLVIKIWSEVVFGKVSQKVLCACEAAEYDLLLLMDIDLPWEPDPLREHPDKREFLFDLYYNEVSKANIPYRIVRGLGAERHDNALAALHEFDKIRLLSHIIQAKHI
jgi:NadR type nicotinamide-nucleotide adenylyltransferase